MKKTGPLYSRIKEDIKDRIKKNEYKNGQMLPTERELCEEYNVCRVTVRKALEQLISEGILERGFGKSATVKPDMVRRNINVLSGLFHELEGKDIKCSSFILLTETIDADNDLATKMGLKCGDKIVKIERIRYANGVPLCFQTVYLNAKLCAGIQLKNGYVSLYETLEREYGIKVTTADQTISAVMADHRMSALLELSEPTSMLLVTRTAYDENDVCVEYTNAYYISGRYQMNMKLKGEG